MDSLNALHETYDRQGRPISPWIPIMTTIQDLGPEELVRRATALNQQLNLASPANQLVRRACDPLPALLTPNEFSVLERGICQRATLLSRVLNDLYGSQALLYHGQLPPSLVLGDPHFLRSLHTRTPLASPRLALYAADLIRSPDGQFRLLRDHTGIIPGLGHAFTMRRLANGILPELFRAHFLRSIRPSREKLIEHLYRSAQDGLVAMLSGNTSHTASPKGLNDCDHFDAALLARALGVLMVEPADLAARNGALHIKTLSGLLRVSTLIRGVSGINLDPLEEGGRPSTGITGAFGAIRAGALTMLNAPGSVLLQSEALRPYIQTLFEPLLGAQPILPLAPPSAEATASNALFMESNGALSEAPLCFRLFAWHDSQEWQVLPGGMGLPLGGGAKTSWLGIKDLWVLDDGEPQMISGIQPSEPPEKAKFLAAAHLPSRLADNLFWLGRSVERLESAVRLLILAMPRLESGTSLPRDLAERTLLSKCLVQAGLLPEEISGSIISGRTLRQALAQRRPLAGLLQEVERLVDAAAERLSSSMLNTVRFALRQALEIESEDETALTGLLSFTATFSGIAAENMSRDGGWLFLEMGKRLERGEALARTFAILLDGPLERLGPGMVLGVELADSVLSYELRYTGIFAPGPVLTMLLADRSNPRALAFQCHALHACLERLGADQDTQLIKTVLQDIADTANGENERGPTLLSMAANLRTLSSRVQRRFFTLLPEAYTLEDDNLAGAVQ